MKLSERLDARRGRTSRSPRMSCSLTTATSAVSKPPSRPSTASATCGFGSASASGHEPTGDRLCRPCSASTCFMRSRAPSLHSAMTTRLPAACSACDVLAHRIEHAGGVFRPLGREIVAGARADIDVRAALVRHRKRRQPRQRRGLQPLGPFGFRQIEPVRRQRLVERPAVLGERLLARLVVVLDLREPLARRVLGQRSPGSPARPARSRTACRACRETAAASAPCRDGGGLRSPPRTACPRDRRRRTPPHSRCGISGSCRS